MYPAVFLIMGWWARRGSFRVRLTVFLVAVIITSYAYSIAFTASNAQSAYFSLLVRAWELALGGLIAVYGQQLQRIPQAWAAVASWVGLAVILVASVTLTPATEYPGALVAIPTLAAGLVIAAGAAAPAWGVERLLRREPFPFLALISFSLYLWHWPILEIAAQSRGVTTLPAWDNVLLLLLAGLLAALTYRFVENPRPPRQIPSSATMGQPHHGRVSDRCHARRDDLRAAPAHVGSRAPRIGDVGLHMPFAIFECTSSGLRYR